MGGLWPQKKKKKKKVGRLTLSSFVRRRKSKNGRFRVGSEPSTKPLVNLYGDVAVEWHLGLGEKTKSKIQERWDGMGLLVTGDNCAVHCGQMVTVRLTAPLSNQQRNPAALRKMCQ